ncbi:MAG TPA: FKBP-type peptidyl-prolyl cis-trans isomerase [Puia sp.]|nr:FKBP-type peptidyl-prolyl cis-trans isomerase [Puia sp.]
MGIADKLFNMKNEKAAANLKAGEEFLAANRGKAGVTSLPSGLQYEVITQGAGPKPTASNKVTCHYHGTLIDGTVFDSSVGRGQPATFPLNAVIKGWTEGLQLMPMGSKWRFFIPAHLGYGDRQVSAQIGPNSTLVFEVELLGIS